MYENNEEKTVKHDSIISSLIEAAADIANFI